MRMGAVGADPKVEAEYYRVPSALFRPGDILEDDVYFLYQGQYVLYKLKDLSWREEDRARLEEFDVRDLFIKCVSKRSHHQLLEKNLTRILESDIVPIREKATILYETSSSLVEEIFEKPTSPENLKRSVKSVKDSIDFLQQKDNFFALMGMATKDFSEYTHAIHTTAYSIALAHQMGLRTFNQISEIAIAALLHDIGKTKIDARLLAKEDVLTGEERRIVEQHPRYSYELLRTSRAVPESSELIVLQHHERPNGQGYPSGMSHEINQFAKIVALCDCFDALTSERPYRKALTPFQAIELLRRELKDEYDQGLLVEFIRMLKK